jgi:hypothetical protein
MDASIEGRREEVSQQIRIALYPAHVPPFCNQDESTAIYLSDDRRRRGGEEGDVSESIVGMHHRFGNGITARRDARRETMEINKQRNRPTTTEPTVVRFMGDVLTLTVLNRGS